MSFATAPQGIEDQLDQVYAALCVPEGLQPWVAAALDVSPQLTRDQLHIRPAGPTAWHVTFPATDDQAPRGALLVLRHAEPDAYLPTGAKVTMVEQEARVLTALPAGAAGVPTLLATNPDHHALLLAALGSTVARRVKQKAFTCVAQRQFQHQILRTLAKLHTTTLPADVPLGAAPFTPPADVREQLEYQVAELLTHSDCSAGTRLMFAEQAGTLDRALDTVDPVLCKVTLRPDTIFLHHGRCTFIDFAQVRRASAAVDLAALAELFHGPAAGCFSERTHLLRHYLQARHAAGQPVTVEEQTLRAALDRQTAIRVLARAAEVRRQRTSGAVVDEHDTLLAVSAWRHRWRCGDDPLAQLMREILPIVQQQLAGVVKTRSDAATSVTTPAAPATGRSKRGAAANGIGSGGPSASDSALSGGSSLAAS